MWVLYLLLASFISTMLPLPPIISPADPTFIGYALTKSFIIVPIMAGFDTLSAAITYYSVDKVKSLVSKVERFERLIKQYTLVLFTHNQKTFNFGYKLLNGEFDVEAFMNKHGKWGVLIAAASPIPYTITIYAVAGSLDIKQFTILNLIGRLFKYIVMYYSVRLGIGIFG